MRFALGLAAVSMALATPSPPIAPLAAFPTYGVWVMRGNHATNNAGCVTDPAATSYLGLAIAAQCCEGNTCRRFVGSNNAAGCIAGTWSSSFTYTT